MPPRRNRNNPNPPAGSSPVPAESPLEAALPAAPPPEKVEHHLPAWVRWLLLAWRWPLLLVFLVAVVIHFYAVIITWFLAGRGESLPEAFGALTLCVAALGLLPLLAKADPASRRHRFFLIAILAGSLLARVVWAIWFPSWGASDFLNYNAIAKAIASGVSVQCPINNYIIRTLPFWTPLYWLFGTHTGVVIGGHCVIGTLTVLNIYFIGWLIKDRRLGLVACYLFALLPALTQGITILNHDIAGLFFLTSFLALFLYTDRMLDRWRPRVLAAAAAGLCLLLVATEFQRQLQMFLLPGILLYLLFNARRHGWHRRKMIKHALILLVAPAGAVWIAQKLFFMRYGQPMWGFLEQQMFLLDLARQPFADPDTVITLKLFPQLPLAEIKDFGWRIYFSQVFHDFPGYSSFLMRKIPYLIDPSKGALHSVEYLKTPEPWKEVTIQFLESVSTMLVGAMMLLAALGLTRISRRSQEAGLSLLGAYGCAYLVMMFLLIHNVQPRYSLSLFPVMTLFAAYFVTSSHEYEESRLNAIALSGLKWTRKVGLTVGLGWLLLWFVIPHMIQFLPRNWFLADLTHISVQAGNALAAGTSARGVRAPQCLVSDGRLEPNISLGIHYASDAYVRRGDFVEVDVPIPVARGRQYIIACCLEDNYSSPVEAGKIVQSILVNDELIYHKDLADRKTPTPYQLTIGGQNLTQVDGRVAETFNDKSTREIYYVRSEKPLLAQGDTLYVRLRLDTLADAQIPFLNKRSETCLKYLKVTEVQ